MVTLRRAMPQHAVAHDAKATSCPKSLANDVNEEPFAPTSERLHLIVQIHSVQEVLGLDFSR